MTSELKKHELGKVFLFVFGAFGLAITCLQGIMPFIEVSKLVKLLSENWVSVIRWPWLVLSDLIYFNLPIQLIDNMNAVLFLAFFIMAFRRGDSFLLKINRKFGIIYRCDNFSNSALGILRYFLTLATFVFPFITVVWILSVDQPAMVIGLMIAFFLDLYAGNGRLSGKVRRRILGVKSSNSYDLILRQEPETDEVAASKKDVFQDLGSNSELSDATARNSVTYMSILLSWVICLILTIILMLNYVAVKSDLIKAKVSDIRCMAEIECVENTINE